MILYVVRAIAYEIPHYGGRARGRRKPQAPTLTERPNGRKRPFSISGVPVKEILGNDKDGSKRSSLDENELSDLTEEG